MLSPQPFTIVIPSSKIDDIRRRVASFPWQTFKSPSDEKDWKYGPPVSYMRRFCDFWLEKYDWTARQARMNTLKHFKVNIEGFDIHFVHEKGSGSADSKPPVLLLHGWPYSFHSFHHLIPQLTQDGLDVIIPSMPGYTFSSPPAAPIGPREICHLYNTLLTQILGYSQYVAHGGDWGSYCAEILAFDFPSHCIGIHLTMISVRHHGAAPKSGEFPADASEEEKKFVEEEVRRWKPESAYARLQSNKPLKLAYAMSDCPVGIAAWIIEAFHAWSDPSTKFEDIFSFNDLLDEIMLYLVTDSFATSTWSYVGELEEGSNTLPKGKRIEVPVGVLALPDPVFPMLPRKVVERSHDVVVWEEGERGGHFPFYEVPEELEGSIRRFVKEGV